MGGGCDAEFKGSVSGQGSGFRLAIATRRREGRNADLARTVSETQAKSGHNGRSRPAAALPKSQLECEMDLAEIPGIGDSVQLGGFPSPATSGVYFLLDADEVVYIGRSRDVRKRIAQHLFEGVKRFDSFRVFECMRDHSYGAERRCIKFFRPRYNKVFIAGLVNEHTPPERPTFKLKRRPRSKTRRWVIVTDSSDRASGLAPLPPNPANRL